MNSITQSFVRYFGDNLESLYRYGRHSSSPVKAKDVYLLAVIKDASQLTATYKKPLFQGVQSLQVFTREELENSLDVFPVEFLEMSLDRELLFGEDLLATMTVSLENVRHQVEYVLRTALLRQRSTLILSPKAQRSTAVESFEDIIRSLRGLLNITKSVQFLASNDVLTAVEEWKGTQFPSLRRISCGDIERVDLNNYCREIEMLVSWIDHL